MNGVAVAVGSAAAVVAAIAISAAVRSGGSEPEPDPVAPPEAETATNGQTEGEDRATPLSRGPAVAEPAPQAGEEEGEQADSDNGDRRERRGRRGDRRGPRGDSPWRREIDPDDLDAQLEAQLARAERMQRWMLERFDEDGDGELNEEELARMREMRDRRLGQMRNRLEGAWGGEIPLDNDELMAYAGIIGRQIGEARREVMEGYLAEQGVSSFRDLSPEQRRQIGPVMREAMENMQQEFVSQYDSSGDGTLSAADRERAASDIREQVATMQNLRLIDLNRDGNTSPAEIQHYLDRFNGGETTADLNSDGVVDVRDLQMFNEVISAN